MRNNKLIIPFIFLALMQLMACSLNSSPVYEVISEEQISKEILSGIPTTFSVSETKDKEAWTRASYFFTTYTSGKPTIESDLFESDKTSSDTYVYKITREINGDLATYTVSCTSVKSGNMFEARENAQNVSRFLQDGHLELNLLHK